MPKPQRLYAGIDYSLTSPAICVVRGSDKFLLENCSLSFLSTTKSLKNKFDNFDGTTTYPEWKSPEERYFALTNWILAIIGKYKFKQSNIRIGIEGYAFAAKGLVFNLAENCGLLKHHLYLNGYTFETIPPSVIKKFATGKGNAKKEKMEEFFFADTGLDIRKHLSLSKKCQNPNSDLIDAFYICKYMYNKDNE